MRVVGIDAPFAQLGWVPGENIEPQGEMGPGDVCRVPPAAVCHGRARQNSGTGPCGDCRRLLWVPGPRGQYSGKIHFLLFVFFIREIWETRLDSRQVAKRSSDPRKAYSEVKVQERDIVRFVGIVASFAPLGVGTRGNFVLSSPRGCRRVLWVPGL